MFFDNQIQFNAELYKQCIVEPYQGKAPLMISLAIKIDQMMGRDSPKCHDPAML